MKTPLSPDELASIALSTLNHYESQAKSFWAGTKDHDVTQNYSALLERLPPNTKLRILDFGCGPGRDLLHFKSLGHEVTGLDGAAAFCKMAEELSGCPVLHQNFLKLQLPPHSFDGIFANASLFHVPRQELLRVLGELRSALVPEGILFSSNPRGDGIGISGGRYGNYMEWETYEEFLKQAGFTPLHHYYRPKDLPRHEQPWLAVVAQRGVNHLLLPKGA